MRRCCRQHALTFVGQAPNLTLRAPVAFWASHSASTWARVSEPIASKLGYLQTGVRACRSRQADSSQHAAAGSQKVRLGGSTCCRRRCCWVELPGQIRQPPAALT